VWAVWFNPRSVDAQKLNWLRVPSFPLVDGDEVEDSVVSEAVDGQSKADGHGGRGEITC